MSHPSDETCALSAPPAEGGHVAHEAFADTRATRDHLLDDIKQLSTLLLYGISLEHQKQLRIKLRSFARLFEIPVKGED